MVDHYVVVRFVIMGRWQPYGGRVIVGLVFAVVVS